MRSLRVDGEAFCCRSFCLQYADALAAQSVGGVQRYNTDAIADITGGRLRSSHWPFSFFRNSPMDPYFSQKKNINLYASGHKMSGKSSSRRITNTIENTRNNTHTFYHRHLKCIPLTGNHKSKVRKSSLREEEGIHLKICPQQKFRHLTHTQNNTTRTDCACAFSQHCTERFSFLLFPKDLRTHSCCIRFSEWQRTKQPLTCHNLIEITNL